MEKISAVLNVFNGEKYLDRVLDALGGFDEIVVCDMESTDCTVEIARSHGARVISFPRGEENICEPARQTVIDAAANPWVLVVDADEIVTPELRDYLYRRVASGDCPEGLAVPFRNMFLGRFIHHKPEYHLRFFRRESVTWPPTIHSIPQVTGRTERIPLKEKNANILHLNDATIYERVGKMNRYTEFDRDRRLHRNFGVGAMLFRPGWAYFKSYLLRGGWRNGRIGLVVAFQEMAYQITLMNKIMEHKIRSGK